MTVCNEVWKKLTLVSGGMILPIKLESFHARLTTLGILLTIGTPGNPECYARAKGDPFLYENIIFSLIPYGCPWRLAVQPIEEQPPHPFQSPWGADCWLCLVRYERSKERCLWSPVKCP